MVSIKLRLLSSSDPLPNGKVLSLLRPFKSKVLRELWKSEAITERSEVMDLNGIGMVTIFNE